MVKYNKEKVEILGGQAQICTNGYRVWQLKLWLTTDNNYV